MLTAKEVPLSTNGKRTPEKKALVLNEGARIEESCHRGAGRPGGFVKGEISR